MTFPSSEPQRLLTDHLLSPGKGKLGFVGVGIGKSGASLDAINQLFEQGETRGVLVLAPMRVANLTWPMEVNKWDDFRWMKVANLRTQAGKRAFLLGKAHIYVCNFEGIPNLLKLVKLLKGKPLPYDTLVIDECFAPGTLVDTNEGKKRIEDLRTGDTVLNAVGTGSVTHLHENVVQKVVKLTVQGKEIICSYDHMFFTYRGWLRAGNITKEDRIIMANHAVRMVQHPLPEQQESTEVLRNILLGEVENAVAVQACMDSRNSEEGIEISVGVPCFRESLSPSPAVPHSKSKTDAERIGTQEIERNSEKDKAWTVNTRRKRNPHCGSPESPLRFAISETFQRLGARVHPSYTENSVLREEAEPLQTRHSFTKVEVMHRGGWGRPSVDSRTRTGSEEDALCKGCGVDNVEVYESTDPFLDKFRSPDGLVRFYDISVSGHPSYSVNGLLVHNCTKIKNPSAKRPQAYRGHVPYDQHKRIWALTGTPAPNSLLDLFAQVRFVDNGKRLGVCYNNFKESYFKQTGYNGYKWTELPKAEEEIYDRISDITLTLRSREWLDIPDTVVEDVDIPLTGTLAQEYREFEKKLILEIKESGTQITAANAAALVSKLLQFTSGAIYDTEKQWHRVHDVKLKALAKIAKDVKSPVLVACGFRHEQHRIRQAFPQARFFEDAKTPIAQQQLLETWNAGKIPMLVAHPRSIGHGLNLQHGGNTIVWFTLTYSREDYEQMIARLARRGQDSVVMVYRLMCPDTVDYAVATAIEDKRSTEDRLLTALQLLESNREKPMKLEKLIAVEEDWV